MEESCQWCRARKVNNILSATKVTGHIGRLTTLDPFLKDSVWVTQGRMRKGLPQIFGIFSLQLLLPHQRLAELIMIAAHNENHYASTTTLARSRSQAWIHRGIKLEVFCYILGWLEHFWNLDSQWINQILMQMITFVTIFEDHIESDWSCANGWGFKYIYEILYMKWLILIQRGGSRVKCENYIEIVYYYSIWEGPHA